MTATDNLENLADVIGADIVALARKIDEVQSAPGDETRRLLRELHASVVKSVELAVEAIRDNDQQAAESVLLMKENLRQQSQQFVRAEGDATHGGRSGLPRFSAPRDVFR